MNCSNLQRFLNMLKFYEMISEYAQLVEYMYENLILKNRNNMKKKKKKKSANCCENGFEPGKINIHLLMGLR